MFHVSYLMTFFMLSGLEGSGNNKLEGMTHYKTISLCDLSVIKNNLKQLVLLSVSLILVKLFADEGSDSK